jgi:hypothetical protein
MAWALIRPSLQAVFLQFTSPLGWVGVVYWHRHIRFLGGCEQSGKVKVRKMSVNNEPLE